MSKDKRPMKRKQPVGHPRIYTEELTRNILNDFAEWIYGTHEETNEEGETIELPNIYFADFQQYVKEQYGIILTLFVNGIRQNNKDAYEEYQALRDMLSQKIIKESNRGYVKYQQAQLELTRRFGWTEKIETKNENVNTQIVWNEQKTYPNTENTENQSVENENDIE